VPVHQWPWAERLNYEVDLHGRLNWRNIAFTRSTLQKSGGSCERARVMTTRLRSSPSLGLRRTLHAVDRPRTQSIFFSRILRPAAFMDAAQSSWVSVA
jgi:hypothetical protein